MDMTSHRGVARQTRHPVEVIVELEVWDEKGIYTRTGLDESTVQILGVDAQLVKLPILPGKNITVISEVIALNYFLKHYVYDAPSAFANNLEQNIAEKAGEQSATERVIPYFEHDFE